MKIKVLAFAAIALLCATASAQQLYKWVAPDGSVSYSDKPPPSNAAKVEKKNFSGGSSVDDLPYELATAAKNNPVTLYTGPSCAPCDSARKLLADRGIPYSEKIVSTNEDITQFTKSTGATQLPVLVVGRIKQQAFSADVWGTTLTSAGYPTSNKMPKTYKNPPAEPLVALAPKPEAEKKPVQQAPTQAPDQQQPANNGQPGFHF